MKKGDLSFQMIVVAIIVLIVLVVAVGLFGSKMRWFGGSINSCTSNQGTCMSEDQCRGSGTSVGRMDDCSGTQICCIQPLGGG